MERRWILEEKGRAKMGDKGKTHLKYMESYTNRLYKNIVSGTSEQEKYEKVSLSTLNWECGKIWDELDSNARTRVRQELTIESLGQRKIVTRVSR